MAPCSSKGLKVKMKEVKVPHLTIANKKKMEGRGLGGLFAVDWNRTYEDMVENWLVILIRNHFHEMDNEEKEDSKKQKALIQTIFDSKTETEDEKEPKEEIPHTTWKGKASGSKPLDKKTTVDYHDWRGHLENLGRETSNLFEAFHVEVGSVTMEVVAWNMEHIFAPPPNVELDIQPWKEMVKNLIKLLTEEQKKNR
ncbi:hypothetical protein R1flu_014364 [Riccia fluitans]|uniref:Uncharacterized protein n=1 Tax=Riccia fluitans TaxID=41844 RepID=A0ABD1YG91_9MARC